MLWNLPLRSRLIISYGLILLVTLLVVGYAAIGSFHSAMEEQANRAIETNMAIAEEMLRAVGGDLEESVIKAALSDELDAADQAETLADELADASKAAGATYFAVLDLSGRVVSSSTHTGPFRTTWDTLATRADSMQAQSFTAIMPQSELEILGLAEEFSSDGALSLVSVAPFSVDRQPRLLVGVTVLKFNNDFVDTVADFLGGTVAVCQGDMYIATTIKDEGGIRMIGTAAPDSARQQTLEKGRPYRGDLRISGEKYLTAYNPLIDPDGAVIGMLSVGLSLENYTTAAVGFAQRYVGMIVVALLAALLVATLIARSLSGPIVGVGAAAHDVSKGDLTVQIPTTGYREARHLGESFNAMIVSLRELIATVEVAASRLGVVSTQISAAAHSSAEHASQQASSVAQATATIGEMLRTFTAVAEGAHRVLEFAEDSLEAAETGRDMIDCGVKTMHCLTSGAEEVHTAAAAMSEASRDITAMTGIIGGIAERTKILAMNAAIEAARAGDAGRGFSVVSTEIRTLADSVAQSANHISDMVVSIQEASAALTHTAERQSQLTLESAAQSGQSRDAFDSILEQMGDTTSAAREIASISSRQKIAVDQIVQAMQQVSTGSDETVSAARQVAAAANEVESEANDLYRALGGFKTTKKQ